MPELPTYTVTAEQGQRILAAFGSEEIYLAWLKAAVREKVTSAELAALDAQQNSEKAAVVADVRTSLP